MEAVVEKNRPLKKLLAAASPDELGALADILTDQGRGRLSLAEDTKNKILDHQKRRALPQIAELLEREICAFGGNTFANMVRSKSIDYAEVARDVADKLGAKVADTDDVHCIEDKVLRALLIKWLEKVSDEERAQYLASSGLGLSEETLDRLAKSTDMREVSNQLMLIWGRGDASTMFVELIQRAVFAAGFAASAMLAGTSGVAAVVGGRVLSLVNPLLAVTAAAGTAYQASGPAFRVTIPAVAKIACIRRTQIDFEFQQFKTRLQACL